MTIKNAKRSGGPKTHKGKEVASQNSLKTGSYSLSPVLPHEDPKEFNQLLDQFNHDFHPADVIENSLVHDLAVITWKRLRLLKLECDYFIKKQNSPVTMEELIDCGLSFNQDRYDFWISQDVLDEDEVIRLTKILNLIKPNFRSGMSVKDLHAVKALDNSLYENIRDAFRQANPLADSRVNDQDLVGAKVQLSNQPTRFLTSIVFEQLIATHEAALWCTKKHENINRAIIQIKQERLLNMMQSGGVRRANDDLSRAFSRALSDFRKHHEWRMRNRVVDAEEE